MYEYYAAVIYGYRCTCCKLQLLVPCIETSIDTIDTIIVDQVKLRGGGLTCSETKLRALRNAKIFLRMYSSTIIPSDAGVIPVFTCLLALRAKHNVRQKTHMHAAVGCLGIDHARRHSSSIARGHDNYLLLLYRYCCSRLVPWCI